MGWALHDYHLAWQVGFENAGLGHLLQWRRKRLKGKSGECRTVHKLYRKDKIERIDFAVSGGFQGSRLKVTHELDRHRLQTYGIERIKEVLQE